MSAEEEQHLTEKKNVQKEKILFWGKDPNEIFSPMHILEFFPVSTMSYEQKLNAVTRLVILLCFVFYFFLRSWRVIMIGIFTILGIVAIYYSNEKRVHFANEEGFQNITEDLAKEYSFPSDIFGEPTDTNPLQNVLITDYDSPTTKKPAIASYTKENGEKIVNETKKMIDDIHPQEPKISNRLFKSLEDNMEFEQSLRPFYSNPSTTIPNDQGAFADFCYGSMVSCKEGNPYACYRDSTSLTRT